MVVRLSDISSKTGKNVFLVFLGCFEINIHYNLFFQLANLKSLKNEIKLQKKNWWVQKLGLVVDI